MREQLEGAICSFAASLKERGIRAQVGLELLGQRPGMGPVNKSAQEALVGRCARVIYATTGQEPRIGAASTDANIPLSLGIPACCVGTVRGRGMHTRGEWVELESLPTGLATILAVMLDEGLDEE